VHKPLFVDVVVVGPFEEEEDRISIASDVVKVQSEDPDTPDYLRGDRVRRDVSDLGSWPRTWVRPPWLARDQRTGAIPQCRFHKTKQHTHSTSEAVTSWSADLCANPIFPIPVSRT